MNLDKIDWEIINAIEIITKRGESFDYTQIPQGIKINQREYKNRLLDLEQIGILKNTGRLLTLNHIELDRWLELANSIGISPSPNPPDLHWTVASCEDLPGPRICPGAAVVNDKIYVMGGFTGFVGHDSAYETPSTLVLDPYASGVWQVLQPMNMPRAYFFAAIGASNGKIYALGGPLNMDSTDRRGFAIYDPNADSWTLADDINIGAMPDEPCTSSAAEINGNIYTVIFAGQGNGCFIAYYDINQNKWGIDIRVLITERVDIALASFGGKLYIMGGRLLPDGVLTDLVEEYDPYAHTVKTKAPMPDTVEEAAVVTVNGRIYVIGGFEGECVKPSDYVFEYNPHTDSWRTMSPLGNWDENAERFGSAAVSTSDGTIYLIGGANALIDCQDPNATEYHTTYREILVGQIY